MNTRLVMWDGDRDKAISVARAHVRLKKPEDADGIADIAIREECAIWHAASLFYGTPCNCMQCKPPSLSMTETDSAKRELLQRFLTDDTSD
jgi:hypothetical protein